MLVWRRQVPVALSLWHFYSPLRFSHFDLSTVCSVKESNWSKTQHAPGLSCDKLSSESSWEEQQLHLGCPEFATRDAGDTGSIPGWGRSLGGGHGNPLQYSSLGNPTEKRSLVDYSPWGCKSQAQVKWISTHTRAQEGSCWYLLSFPSVIRGTCTSLSLTQLGVKSEPSFGVSQHHGHGLSFQKYLYQKWRGTN